MNKDIKQIIIESDFIVDGCVFMNERLNRI